MSARRARRIEPAHVADLGGKSHSDKKRGAAHRLVGFHDRRHRPLRHDESELFLEATQALNRIFDRVDPFLKDDLLRGMFELLAGKPTPMRQRPMAASAVNPTVPQQKGKQLLGRLRRRSSAAASRARTRSRTAS